MLAYLTNYKYTQVDIDFFKSMGCEVELWSDEDGNNQELRLEYDDRSKDAIQGYLTEEEYASLPENLDYVIFWR